MNPTLKDEETPVFKSVKRRAPLRQKSAEYNNDITPDLDVEDLQNPRRIKGYGRNGVAFTSTSTPRLPDVDNIPKSESISVDSPPISIMESSGRFVAPSGQLTIKDDKHMYALHFISNHVL